MELMYCITLHACSGSFLDYWWMTKDGWCKAEIQRLQQTKGELHSSAERPTCRHHHKRYHSLCVKLFKRNWFIFVRLHGLYVRVNRRSHFILYMCGIQELKQSAFLRFSFKWHCLRVVLLTFFAWIEPPFTLKKSQAWIIHLMVFICKKHCSVCSSLVFSL